MSKPTRQGSTRGSHRDHGRYAAGLFAATVCVTAGVGFCLTMSFVFAPDAWQPLALIAGGVVGLVVIIRLLMDRPLRKERNSNCYWAQREWLSQYVESFRPNLRRRIAREFGTNRPPTPEGLREIKENSNVWHPSDRRVEEYRRALDDDAFD